MTGRVKSMLIASLMIVAATTMSLIATGFAYGINNNVFHIPYVLGYAHLPQFRGDAFYASLDHYVSLVWPLIRAVSTESNVSSVFFAAHVISRLLAFVALHFFFRLNGLKQPIAILIALIATAATPWLMKYSVIGAHGLLIDYFTHSEVTWPLAIGALIALQFRRFLLMGILSGLTFAINPFIAFWLLAIMTVAILMCGYWRDFAGLLKAAAVFLLIATPELVWTLSSIQTEAAQPPLDFHEYLSFYIPEHFLIDVAGIRGIVNLGLIFCAAILASAFTSDRRYWSAIVLGGLLLVVIGSAAVYLFDGRLLFFLHFVRSAGMLQFIGISLAILALVRITLTAEYSNTDRVLGALGLMTLLQPLRDPVQLGALVVILALLVANNVRTDRVFARSFAGRLNRDIAIVSIIAISLFAYDVAMHGLSLNFAARWSAAGLFAATFVPHIWPTRLPALRIASLVAMAVFAMLAIARWRIDEAERYAVIWAPFQEMTDWIRQNGVRGPFLVPADKPHRELFDRFQIQALQPVWVDHKQGGAVMWAPALYAQWRPRLDAVVQLRGPETFVRYATANHIPYIALPRDIGPCPAGSAIFDNGSYAICRTPSTP